VSGACRTSPPPGWHVEGAPPDTSRGRKVDGSGTSRGRRRFWWVLIGLLAVNWTVVNRIIPDRDDRSRISYNTFLAQVDDRNVKEMTTRGFDVQGEFRAAVDLPGDAGKATRFRLELPTFADTNCADKSCLDLLLRRNGVEINARPLDTGRPLWQTLFFSFGPTILLVLLFVMVLKSVVSDAAGARVGLGRSGAQRIEGGSRRTTFEDVAGIDEAEEELVEIVDFLRDPEKYRRLGGKIPRGVLLSGPPGTGKTLMARAVAGEANVPFFSLSASEFVEMVVGVGASRVRDLFDEAKAAAPAIIFIDELDSIGRARSSGSGGAAHDEREQTLNQILTEMDGFEGSEGVIVLAATNRADVLDPALLRPGRFDRRVVVNPPDQAGRTEILRIHSRDVPLSDDVDLARIAASTPGMVGAELANLVNEAALSAARRGAETVATTDFTNSFEKIVLGSERKLVRTPHEKERTAYHEVGHALLGMLIPGADPVRKVSIVPRGDALGVTFQAPESDRYGYGAQDLRGRITGTLGGRAAEDLIYGDHTTGAESDLEQVTFIARQMVGRWGMSERIGPVSVLPNRDEEDTFFPVASTATSERTRQLVDEEVRQIVEECYDDACGLLEANRDRLDALARALLERETLDELDAYRWPGSSAVRRCGDALLRVG
jgi:cell division protease FtsH